MKWFKLYADFQHHPKRYRFEELAGTIHGLHYLTAWFSYVCRFAPSGDVSQFRPADVARACEWPTDKAQTLWDALVGAGFIENTENGLRAHDWFEENGRFIKENDKRKPTKGDPRETQGLPVLQDRTGQDNTRQEPKPSQAAPSEFDAFWQAYPKKVSKGSALKAWLKHKPPLQACLDAVRWQKTVDPWTKGMVHDPATWLNASKWLDEPPREVTREQEKKQLKRAAGPQKDPLQEKVELLEGTKHLNMVEMLSKQVKERSAQR
jgi:hypothetical protein